MLRLMNSLRMRTPTQLTSTSRRLTSQRCNHFQLARLGCRAASGGPSDRSWADLAGDAANLAKYHSYTLPLHILYSSSDALTN